MGVLYVDVSRLPQRRPDDVYETDRRTATFGAKLVTGRPERILDPAAGSGIYGEVLRERFPEATIDGVELRDVPRPAVYDGWAQQTRFQEFAARYQEAGGPLYDAIVTNPPFGQLDLFVESAWPLLAPGGELIYLTQVRYLEGQRRARRIWGPMTPRDIVILTVRPSFQEDGKSSPAAFCYVDWQKRIEGQIDQPRLFWAVADQNGDLQIMSDGPEADAAVIDSTCCLAAPGDGTDLLADEGGEKVGSDPCLEADPKAEEPPAPAAGAPHPLSDSEKNQEAAEDDADVPLYEETDGGLVWNKRTRDGIDSIPLTNFQARIVTDVLEDDGADRTRKWEVVGRVNGREIRFDLPPKALKSMDWVGEQLGAEALLYPGAGVREHTRVAIQLLSRPIRQRTDYTHFGWRKIDGQWVYLHTAGAIGPAGLVVGVQVKPPPGLDRYRLPALPTAAVMREAIRRSLGFLEVGARAKTWHFLAAALASVLAEFLGVDFCLWVYGLSGGRKSSVAALVLCHFGQFDRHSLTASFIDTPSGLEVKLFAAKDALAVVDDYAPASDSKTAAQQDEVVHRLLRSIGDRRARSRATTDVKLQGGKPPRALPLATAEGPPPGSQSSEARTLQVEWLPNEVDLDRLTRAQQEDAPYYPITMTGFLTWLAPQIEELRDRLAVAVRATAQRFTGDHGRVRDAAAKLYLPVELFLDFAESVGAIDAKEKQVLLAEAFGAFAATAERTGRLQAERRPTVLALESLRALLTQGRVYLADRRSGSAPGGDPGRWGYVIAAIEGEKSRNARPQAGAVKVGWVDEEEGLIFLLPPAAFEAITRFSRSAGLRFPVTQRALGDHLDREGLLARKTDGRREYRVRLEGKPEWCWAIPVEILFPDDGNCENDEND